jgi:hypothetical protein
LDGSAISGKYGSKKALDNFSNTAALVILFSEVTYIHICTVVAKSHLELCSTLWQAIHPSILSGVIPAASDTVEQLSLCLV